LTVKFVAPATLPTQWGQFTIHGFEDQETGKEHVALVLGESLVAASAPVETDPSAPLLCRIHSECLTGDCLFSLRCDCGSQLKSALQDSGADTVEANEQLGFEADSREYNICKPMLEHFRVSSVRLMTNNPRKVQALQEMGIEVAEIVPIHTGSNPHNESYLAVNIDKLGHIK